MKQKALVAALACAAAFNQAALAAVTAEEAAQLGKTLTPLGAERAGNKEGTIPEWDGGMTKAIPGTVKGKFPPDPFASDKPVLSISAKNMDAYADKLSEGTKAMMKKHAGYRIDVYPTRRTASAPQWVYKNTASNATRAKSAHGGLSVEGAHGGVPFPIPKTGNEIMWNHLLRWEGETYRMSPQAIVVSANGKRVLASRNDVVVKRPYYDREGSPEKTKEFWLFRLTSKAPAFKAGESILLRNQLDMSEEGPQSWQYIVGQRRVRRAPSIGYDTPDFVASGANFFDEAYVFMGRQDRFDFKLIGKKEMYIPYNTNAFHHASIDEAFSENYLNPEKVRWELHRVWVVEAQVKEGKRHAVAKRRYYVDEDTWNAVLVDGWDAKGQLWKAQFSLPVVVPELPGVYQGPYGLYDLLSGQWVMNNARNEITPQYELMPSMPDSYFTPDEMAGQSLR